MFQTFHQNHITCPDNKQFPTELAENLEVLGHLDLPMTFLFWGFFSFVELSRLPKLQYMASPCQSQMQKV